MTFAQGYLSDPASVQGGEVFTEHGTRLGFSTFEDGLLVGRFAKLDAGSLDNLDASVSPVIAGVVTRDVTGAIEDDGTIKQINASSVSVMREGLVSVDVKAGESAPALGARVQAWNTADADVGLAVASGGVDTTAEFVEALTETVWLVRPGAYSPA